MEVIILCGGRGERLREYTDHLPKPMVRVCGKPLLWYLMNLYSRAGFYDFTLCLGYKADVIRDYFSNTTATRSGPDARSRDQPPSGRDEGWHVRLVDTGEDVMTGGRLKRVEDVVGGDTFLMTYSDCVADIDFRALIACHHIGGRTATVTAVKPPARFGVLQLDGERVLSFEEKNPDHEPWINGGFFVFNRGVFDLLSGDATVLETDILAPLAAANDLSAYVHRGYWQCMDTASDVDRLNDQCRKGIGPWPTWTGV